MYKYCYTQPYIQRHTARRKIKKKNQTKAQQVVALENYKYMDNVFFFTVLFSVFFCRLFGCNNTNDFKRTENDRKRPQLHIVYVVTERERERERQEM